MEPILRADQPYKADKTVGQSSQQKHVHTFPNRFLWCNIILILLLFLMYAFHLDLFGSPWFDFYSGNPEFILAQTLLILVLFSVFYWRSLLPGDAGGFVLRESASATIMPAYRFLRIQYYIFVGCTLCTTFIELKKGTPLQSILIAFFFIATLLYFWPKMRAWRLLRMKHKMGSSLADLTRYYEEKRRSSSSPSSS